VGKRVHPSNSLQLKEKAMSQHRLTLPLLGMFVVSAGFILFVFARSADSACSAGCSLGCKLDNNWCEQTGTMEGELGWKFFTNDQYTTALEIIPDETVCIEDGTSDGESAETTDVVDCRAYDDCTPDCPTYDDWTPGAPDTETFLHNDTKLVYKGCKAP
jgi:hypothetical protein